MIWEEKFWNSSVEGEKVADIVFTRGLFPWIVVSLFDFFFWHNIEQVVGWIFLPKEEGNSNV
jgi:hypothetical protein